MEYKLLRIDELTVADHSYLDLTEDACYYMMEYASRKGPQFSPPNSLIHNFKKKMDRKDLPDFKYKAQAINQVSDLLSKNFFPFLTRKWTFVPMPPSHSKDDPMYDDRVSQVVEKMGGGKADIRELIQITRNMPPSHGSEARLTPDEIYAYFNIKKDLINPPPERIIVVDDVITAGAHYKAAKRILLETFPNILEIRGVFIARRVFL
jgi:hypothetical protein